MIARSTVGDAMLLMKFRKETDLRIAGFREGDGIMEHSPFPDDSQVITDNVPKEYYTTT